MTHLLLAATYAACVSTVFASLLRPDLRSAVRFGATLFAVMVGSVLVLGWVMYLLAG